MAPLRSAHRGPGFSILATSVLDLKDASHMSNGERTVHTNGVELCVETFGDASDPAILLIHGACASMIWWEEELCERIARQQRFVIRFDNRDTGRSTTFPVGQPGYSFVGQQEGREIHTPRAET